MRRALGWQLASAAVLSLVRGDAHPLLRRAGLRQHVVDELEGQIAGQLAQMARGEYPGGDGQRSGKRRGHDRLRRQRDLCWCEEDRDGSDRPTRGVVAQLITRATTRRNICQRHALAPIS